MKRTTLVIPSAIYLQLKQRAAAEGRTLSDVVEQALRLGLETLTSARRSRVTLPSYDLGPFLLDPADRSAWSEALERAERPEET